MSAVSFLLVCTVTFLLGLIAGLFSKADSKNEECFTAHLPSVQDIEADENLNREYRNFLSYDGTEQN